MFWKPPHIIPAADLAHEKHDDSPLDRGLAYDLGTLIQRRAALRLLGGGASVLALAACGDGGSVATSSSTSSAGTSTGSSATATTTPAGEVPDETGGPYPADGSNGLNVLDDDGIVRSDITRSFGTSTTVVDGIPMTINLTVTDSAAGYAAITGAGVYLWHCTPDGAYSMYSSGVENENYLRGVVATDAKGTATFTSVFPGCYEGRWPHIHFEVYGSATDATGTGRIVKTSQIALPRAACAEAYTDGRYGESASALGRVSLASDNVFSDDQAARQLATVTGDVTSGYVVNLTIGV